MFDIKCHLSLLHLSAGTKYKIHAVFRSQCTVWVYTQALLSKVYAETVKIIHINFSILNRHVYNSCKFQIYQKHLFLWGKTKKLEITVFPIYSLFIYASTMTTIIYGLSRWK